MKVQDIMTRDVKCCTKDINLAAIGGCMWEHDCGAVPVVDDEGKLIGMITDRDICIALATRDMRASELLAGDVISGRAYFCVPGDDIKVALRTMESERVRRLPVVDEANVLKGILSMDDIVLAAEKVAGKRVPDFSYEHLIKALTASSGHRFEQYQAEPRMAEGAAVA